MQEAHIRTVKAAVDAYGLKSLPGSDGEIEVQEDVGEMSKGWKQGDSLTFTTKFAAIFDPARATSATSEATTAKSETVEESS